MILCALVITQIGEEEDCELGGGLRMGQPPRGLYEGLLLPSLGRAADGRSAAIATATQAAAAAAVAAAIAAVSSRATLAACAAAVATSAAARALPQPSSSSAASVSTVRVRLNQHLRRRPDRAPRWMHRLLVLCAWRHRLPGCDALHALPW